MANEDKEDKTTSETQAESSSEPDASSPKSDAGGSTSAKTGAETADSASGERKGEQPDPESSERVAVPAEDVDSERSEAEAEQQVAQNPLPPGDGSERPGVAPEAVPVSTHDEHHGLAHTTPVKLLVGIFAALIILTFITVGVTSVDLGASGNLIIAMVIATIKAALVAAFFMHLTWDRPFNRLAFLSSVLFLALLISISLTDRKEYQDSIDELRAAEGEQ